jgi:hypothetical protein
MKTISILAAAALACTAATRADAQMVTRSYAVTASGFEAGAPMGIVKGIFEFTYDSAAYLTAPSPVGLTISGFDLPYAGPALFSFNRNYDMLTVGNNIGFNMYTVSPSAPGFGFFLNSLSSVPTIGSFLYSANGQVWHASQFSVTDPSAVPEASSWALVIGGVAVAGGTLRHARRRRAVRRAFA